MITTPPTATILHLSDLHLGKGPADTGRKDKATLKSAIKKRRIEMQTHDPYIFAGLRLEVRLAARYMGAPNDSFDFHVVTGDISTNATSYQRFAFARKFLTGNVRINRTYSAGLGLSKDSILCVPGNHDKMYEAKLVRYLKSFNDLPQPLPYVVEKKVSRSNQQFVFLWNRF
jgi:3',5'-cyclic AMP phosphodiesterase CpdA